MKKIALFLSLVLISLTSCSRETKIEDINPNSKEYSKIKVSQEEIELSKIIDKPIKTRTAYSKFSDKYIKGGGKEIMVEKINFDESGFRTEHVRYVSNGDVDLQWLYDYDYYNKLISVEAFDGYRKPVYKSSINYDHSGYKKSIEEKGEKENSNTSKGFVYDDNYNLIKINYYNHNGELTNFEDYIYNNNKLDSLYKYKANKELVSVLTFTYDSLGRISKETLAGNRLKPLITTYKYGESDQLVEIRNSILSSFQYSYDSNGNLISEIELNSGGFLQSKFTYRYNKDNLVIEKLRYDGEDDVALQVRFEYEFY